MTSRSDAIEHVSAHLPPCRVSHRRARDTFDARRCRRRGSRGGKRSRRYTATPRLGAGASTISTRAASTRPRHQQRQRNNDMTTYASKIALSSQRPTSADHRVRVTRTLRPRPAMVRQPQLADHYRRRAYRGEIDFETAASEASLINAASGRPAATRPWNLDREEAQRLRRRLDEAHQRIEELERSSRCLADELARMILPDTSD